jgi:soluble lytic murein transglycosylase-like protein
MMLLLLLFPLVGLGEHPMLAYILESGNTRMLSDWAARYEHGVYVPQNIDRAIELYCKAAQAGDSRAQYSLGAIYAQGRAGKINEVLAAAWLNLAADQGHVEAKAKLIELGAYGGRLRGQADCVSSKNLIAQALPKLPPASIAKFRGSNHPNFGKVEHLVKKLAPQYGLNPDLVLAVVAAESNFNPRALSQKNAKGLMQLIPQTAARFGVRDIWDPEQNLRGGMAYLRWLLGYFNGDLRLALAAYNAGEQTVDKYGGIPPYPETRNYVRRITNSLSLEETI